MPDFRYYRDSSGGKAIVDFQADVPASAVSRQVQVQVSKIVRPLIGGSAVGAVLAKSENPQALPPVRPWHVTTSQVVDPSFISTTRVS